LALSEARSQLDHPPLKFFRVISGYLSESRGGIQPLRYAVQICIEQARVHGEVIGALPCRACAAQP
jgi:hypothetical protein